MVCIHMHASFIANSQLWSFPEKSGMAYAIFDTIWGLGCSIGPVVGGYLYEYGDFQLPMFVIGASIFVSKDYWLIIDDGQGVSVIVPFNLCQFWKSLEKFHVG